MKKLLDAIRIVKNNLEKVGYVVKNHEGKPFFGEVNICLNDGKIVHSKNRSMGEFDVTESVKA
jgi:hypothetical protein